MRTRRSGWLILLAVVVATLGGALAVRMKKRPQTTPSGPPEVKPRPATATVASDAERSLVRMAIGAGIFVVLAIATVVVTAPRGDGAARPVDRDEQVTLTGDDGARVEIGIRPVGFRPTPSIYPGEGFLFWVHLHNTGKVWVTSRIDPAARLLDASGATYAANQMLSIGDGPYGSTDPWGNPAWRLEPGWQIERKLVFTIPPDAHLTRLRIAVAMGAATPIAEWNL